MKIKDKQQSVLNHQIAPRQSAWLRLDSKLEGNRSKVKIYKYKFISIAAVMLAILGVTAVFLIQENNYNNNELLQPYTVDVMDTNVNDIGIYEVQKLKSLKLAYNKHSGKIKI